MCLYVEETKTAEFKRNTTGPVAVWKVYAVEDGHIYSPIKRRDPIEYGLIVSNRPVTSYPFTPDFDVACQYNYPRDYSRDVWNDNVCVHPGIHVCLTRESARGYKNKLEQDFPDGMKPSGKPIKHVIFRCWANPNDFVATGFAKYYGTHKNCAVFTKVYLSETDKEKALNGDFR